MASEKLYRCSACGREVRDRRGHDTHSDCCQAAWLEVEPLPVCQSPASSEHTRADATDEPCDDGRGG